MHTFTVTYYDLFTKWWDSCPCEADTAQHAIAIVRKSLGKGFVRFTAH